MMHISDIITQALAEDLGGGDHTSLATIPIQAEGSASLIIKQKGMMAGLIYAIEVFRQVDPLLKVDLYIQDGTFILPGDIAFDVSGASRSILQAERLVLNIMQRLSGIATYTSSLVHLVSGYPVKLLDTRKTTPILREMEKYAVRIGGGFNHRMGLYDMIMIKDNHVDYSGGISNAIQRVRHYLDENSLNLKIEIEVRNFSELNQVLAIGCVHRIMLDNFSPANLTTAVQIIGHRFETEASGGICEANLREYAATGVDFISIGALTHHVNSIDMSLKAC